jgi:hypothetical protein
MRCKPKLIPLGLIACSWLLVAGVAGTMGGCESEENTRIIERDVDRDIDRDDDEEQLRRNIRRDIRREERRDDD